jgi:predicted ABC-class ATPase
MESSRAVPAESPASLRASFVTPNRGEVCGMIVPAGVTLVVGGGYHGKSTLLKAIERGVYNHIPGDGRELVVTADGAVKIRAEDGRRVEKVDISAFLTNLPSRMDTREFSTDDASGSTSQAANIVEAMEVGAELLLMDEDTCATNFMIRDKRMQELVHKDKEPITPFLDRVKDLSAKHGVSSILVLGGSGDYFDVADTVISLDAYRPQNVTDAARKVAAKYRTQRGTETDTEFAGPARRVPLSQSFDARRGRRDVKIDAKSIDEISFGRTRIDLSSVEQIVDTAQTRAIGDAILYISQKYTDGSYSMREIVEAVERDIAQDGLDVLSPFPGRIHGGYALPRRFEIAAAINRMRTLSVRQLP